MDISDQLAIVAVGGVGQLQTLKTLLANIVSKPAEQKYRNVSIEALGKRGLSPEGFEFLSLLGFDRKDGRLHFRSEPGPDFHVALSAVEELQKQASSSIEGDNTSNAVQAPLQASDQGGHGDDVGSHDRQQTAKRHRSQTDKDAQAHSAGELQVKLTEMGFPGAQVQQALGNFDDNEEIELEAVLKAMKLTPNKPEQSQFRIADSQTLANDGWECPICFTVQEAPGWNCPSSHQFCKECMRQHVDAVTFPRCPQCVYELGQSDLEILEVAASRIEAFQHGKLCKAVDTLAQNGEMLVRCSDGSCPNVVLLPAGSSRQQFSCSVCNARSFCTMCRQAPYHFHAECGRVQPLREQWLTWISGGREEYFGRARVAAEDDRRNNALYEGIARHNELEADERWKAENCRLCPGCSRPISKVEGCDSMVCGRAYHGGDQQPGCGQEFDWQQAAPYVAHIERRALPELKTEHAKLRGRTAFHPFTDCNLCGGSGQGISGLRFRCIHCPALDVCSACEPQLANMHEHDHVFEILFESDFRCPWLPRGTRVRIVRTGDRPPRSLTRSNISQLEGQFGKVIGRRRPPLEGYTVELELGQGTVVMAMEHLEPVLNSRAEAEHLLCRTLDDDGEEVPMPAPAPIIRPMDSDDDASGSDESLPRHPRIAGLPGPALRVPRRGRRIIQQRQAIDESPLAFNDFADDSPLSEAEAVPPQHLRALRRRAFDHRAVPARQNRTSL